LTPLTACVRVWYKVVMNRAQDKAARASAQEARTAYRAHLATLNDDELDNEDYTYKYESRHLNYSDDEIGDRLGDIEREKTQRNIARI